MTEWWLKGEKGQIFHMEFQIVCVNACWPLLGDGA